jgi:hypothetical protein
MLVVPLLEGNFRRAAVHPVVCASDGGKFGNLCVIFRSYLARIIDDDVEVAAEPFQESAKVADAALPWPAGKSQCVDDTR